MKTEMFLFFFYYYWDLLGYFKAIEQSLLFQIQCIIAKQLNNIILSFRRQENIFYPV